METLPAKHFRFGDFELDSPKRLLLKDGQPVALNSKTFDLLFALVENHGEVLSKDELLERVWPGQFVEEGNLTVQVSTLRKIFGERKDEHRFIVTVPGRGYSFVAELDDGINGEIVIESHRRSRIIVEEETAENGFLNKSENAAIDYAQLPSALPSIRQKRGFLVALSVLILAAAGLGYWFLAYIPSDSASIESLAVMPFVNESGNADNEYLSDGMTETLISSLSRLPRLSVKARSSVFRYKGKDVSPKTVGKELSVQAVLLGRVIQRGDQLTLSLELVDARTENVIWSDQYNRKQTKLLSLQSEIARDVSQKLRQRLTGADVQKVTKNYTENAEAYQLYLKGRYHWNKLDEDGYKKSLDYYQQATVLDPNYALAYAGIADAYSLAADWYLSNREAMEKSKLAATRALELDDTLAETHAAMGTIRMFLDWNWPETEKEYRRAIELNPNQADPHQWYSFYLGAVQGQHIEAIEEARQAQQLDPFSRYANMYLAQAFIWARQYDRAIEQLHETLEWDQNFWWAHSMLGLAYERKGQFREAIAELQKARQLDNNPFILGQLGRNYARSGKRAEAQKLIAELKELSRQRYVSSNFIAEIYAALGERDKVFEWLEKSFEERSIGMLFLKNDPLWDDLRSDQRFQDLVRRVGLP
jgi:TolB-like protein/DNA-binding winged helix-turn-helix (wHTH) protein/Tfp pilus assembly protein PilF